MFTNLLSIPVPIFKRPLLTTMMATLVATASLTGCTSPDSSDSETQRLQQRMKRQIPYRILRIMANLPLV